MARFRFKSNRSRHLNGPVMVKEDIGREGTELILATQSLSECPVGNMHNNVEAKLATAKAALKQVQMEAEQAKKALQEAIAARKQAEIEREEAKKAAQEEESKKSAALAARELAEVESYEAEMEAEQAKKAAQEEEAKMNVALAARKQAEIERELAKKAAQEEEAKKKVAIAAAAAAELKRKQIETEQEKKLAEVEAARMKLNQLEADTCAEYIRFEVAHAPKEMIKINMEKDEDKLAAPAPVEMIKIKKDHDEDTVAMSDSDSELSSASAHIKEKPGLFSFLSNLQDALFGSDEDLFYDCLPETMPSSGVSCHF